MNIKIDDPKMWSVVKREDFEKQSKDSSLQDKMG